MKELQSFRSWNRSLKSKDGVDQTKRQKNWLRWRLLRKHKRLRTGNTGLVHLGRNSTTILKLSENVCRMFLQVNTTAGKKIRYPRTIPCVTASNVSLIENSLLVKRFSKLMRNLAPGLYAVPVVSPRLR